MLFLTIGSLQLPLCSGGNQQSEFNFNPCTEVQFLMLYLTVSMLGDFLLFLLCISEVNLLAPLCLFT